MPHSLGQRQEATATGRRGNPETQAAIAAGARGEAPARQEPRSHSLTTHGPHTGREVPVGQPCSHETNWYVSSETAID